MIAAQSIKYIPASKIKFFVRFAVWQDALSCLKAQMSLTISLAQGTR